MKTEMLNKTDVVHSKLEILKNAMLQMHQVARTEKQQQGSGVRKTGVSRHHGGIIEAPLKPLEPSQTLYYMKGFPQLGPH